MAVHYKYIKLIKDTGFTYTEAALLVGLTATSTELNILDGVTATTAQVEKLAVDGIDVTTSTLIDASGGGTAETTAVMTVPLGCIIKEVVAVVTATFDGDATQTFEVGITGNTDAYIDPSDFDPAGSPNAFLSMSAGTNNDVKFPQWNAAAVPIIATWTNTGSTSAGSVTVYVTYTSL